MRNGPLSNIDWKTCKNNSGEDVSPFSVLRLSDITTIANVVVRVGVEPDTTFGQDYIVTGPRWIKNGKTGPCFPPGEVLVRYDTGTPTIGEGYGPKPGEPTVSKSYPQTAICRGIVDATKKIMLATWGPIVEAYATANGSISAGSSGAISIHQGTLGSTTAIPSMDPSIFNAGVDVVNGDPLMVGIILGQLAFTKLCT